MVVLDEVKVQKNSSTIGDYTGLYVCIPKSFAKMFDLTKGETVGWTIVRIQGNTVSGFPCEVLALIDEKRKKEMQKINL